MSASSREKTNTKRKLARATTKFKSRMQTVTNGHVSSTGSEEEHPNIGDLIE